MYTEKAMDHFHNPRNVENRKRRQSGASEQWEMQNVEIS